MAIKDAKGVKITKKMAEDYKNDYEKYFGDLKHGSHVGKLIFDFVVNDGQKSQGLMDMGHSANGCVTISVQASSQNGWRNRGTAFFYDKDGWVYNRGSDGDAEYCIGRFKDNKFYDLNENLVFTIGKESGGGCLWIGIGLFAIMIFIISC